MNGLSSKNKDRLVSSPSLLQKFEDAIAKARLMYENIEVYYPSAILSNGKNKNDFAFLYIDEKDEEVRIKNLAGYRIITPDEAAKIPELEIGPGCFALTKWTDDEIVNRNSDWGYLTKHAAVIKPEHIGIHDLEGQILMARLNDFRLAIWRLYNYDGELIREFPDPTMPALWLKEIDGKAVRVFISLTWDRSNREPINAIGKEREYTLHLVYRGEIRKIAEKEKTILAEPVDDESIINLDLNLCGINFEKKRITDVMDEIDREIEQRTKKA